MKIIKIELPEHAIEYLKEMCKQQRSKLVHREYVDQSPPSLQDLAEFDSLQAIENSLP